MILRLRRLPVINRCNGNFSISRCVMYPHQQPTPCTSKISVHWHTHVVVHELEELFHSAQRCTCLSMYFCPALLCFCPNMRHVSPGLFHTKVVYLQGMRGNGRQGNKLSVQQLSRLLAKVILSYLSFSSIPPDFYRQNCPFLLLDSKPAGSKWCRHTSSNKHLLHTISRGKHLFRYFFKILKLTDFRKV